MSKNNASRMNSVTKFTLETTEDCQGKLQIVKFKCGGKLFKLYVYGEKNHHKAQTWKVYAQAWGNVKSFWFTSTGNYTSIVRESDVRYAHIDSYKLTGIYPDEKTDELTFQFVLVG